VITGFNTDIEHDGVVYHVQTEDKGLKTPIILSLVYSGGTILASKRAPYEDLIAEGFSDEALADRLKRQHRLICAAIHSGRINDLKKMSPRAADVANVPTEPKTEVVEQAFVEDVDVIPEVETAAEVPVEMPIEEVILTTDDLEVVEPEPFEDIFEIASVPSQVWAPPEKVEPPVLPAQPEPEPEPEIIQPQVSAPYSVHDSRGQLQVQESVLDDGLNILLLDDAQFYSGEARTLRVLVVNRTGSDETPLGSVAISIKILGTTFRPQLYSLKTDRDGVASVATQIPSFTSGRAAVLIRAVAKDQAAELRRIINPGR
jgi:hypothetical protein